MMPLNIFSEIEYCTSKNINKCAIKIMNFNKKNFKSYFYSFFYYHIFCIETDFLLILLTKNKQITFLLHLILLQYLIKSILKNMKFVPLKILQMATTYLF